MHYKIHPAGVAATLHATAAQLAAFDKAVCPLGSRLEAVKPAAGGSRVIAYALNQLFTAERLRLLGVHNRAVRCLEGAAAATTAYVRHDEEVARTYQANATRAANHPLR